MNMDSMHPTVMPILVNILGWNLCGDNFTKEDPSEGCQ